MVVADVHAQVPHFRHWITDREGPPHIGTQVKIERFTFADAKNIRAAGFSFVRFGIWVNSMPATAYQARVSRAFAAAHSAGLPVLVTLRSTVPLVQSSSNEANRRLQVRDAAKQLVVNVRQLVGVHGPDVLAIEVWNEPELPTYWPTGDVDATFPVYIQAVCAGLKTVDRSIPVVGFGFATPPASGSKSDRLLQSLDSSPQHCLDAISYHAYGMSEAQIKAASGYVQSRYALPALITEWGVSSGSKRGRDGQAADIESFFAQRDAMKTPLVSIYEWQDTASGKNARERNFGLIDASGTKKPALEAASAALHKQ